MSIGLLLEMVRVDFAIEHGVRTLEGVPADAAFLGSFTDPASDTAYLKFSHPSFEPVEPGVSLPVLRVVHQKVAP